MKRFPPKIFILLMVLIPVMGMAQIPDFTLEGIAGGDGSGSKGPVGFLPITGETPPENQEFYDAVFAEIPLSTKYTPFESHFPDTQAHNNDEPPEAVPLEPGMRYMLTGEIFNDQVAGEYSLQLWLWDMQEVSLVYTDELVGGDIEEAKLYMPAMIEWIFSHIKEPEETPVVVEAPPPDEDTTGADTKAAAPSWDFGGPGVRDVDIVDDTWKFKWLYLGARGGISYRFYTDPIGAPNYTTKFGQAVTWEAALQFELQVLPFLHLQTEILATQENAAFRHTDGGITYTERLRSFNIIFPLLAKFSFKPNRFLIAPYLGAYYFLPLGKMSINSDKSPHRQGALETYDYSVSVPIGYTLGITLGTRVATGIVIFADLRYSADIGSTRVENVRTGETREYFRNMASLTIGMQYGFFDKQPGTASSGTK